MMKKNKEITVFFDLDGTLFDWNYDGEYRIEGYYKNLPARRAICETADYINGLLLVSGVRLKVCTISSYLTDLDYDPIEEKNIALDRETNIPRNQRYYLPCGESKWEYVKNLGLADNAILIDDYGQNIKDWLGTYIKVSKDAKDMMEELNRHEYCISPESSKEECLNTICYAVENM